MKLRSFLLTLLLALPLRSEPRKVVVVRGTDHTCPAQLSDGTTYEIHYRTLRTRWHDRDVHVVVKAYYKPGSGEFLYYSSIWSEEDYSRTVKQHEAWSCKPNDGSVVLLAGGQWADFMALTSGPRLEVFHSRLRFSSIEGAWRHVSTHFDECQTLAAKCYNEIPLYKDLDFDFFRPESFRQNAAPYDYNPLVSVKRVGSTWEVVIRGADEPNRALFWTRTSNWQESRNFLHRSETCW